MILVDTNILLALADLRDPKRPRALADLDRFESRGLLLTWPVLTETFHFLKRSDQRRTVLEMLGDLNFRLFESEHAPNVAELVDWMLDYREHTPDVADAYLVLATLKLRRLSVWSYDSEFRTIWRRPDGSPVPLAARV